MTSNTQHDYDTDEINVAELLIRLFGQWRLIVSTTALVAIVSGALGSLQPYKASTEIRPLPTQTTSGFQALNDFLAREKLEDMTATDALLINELVYALNEGSTFTSTVRAVFGAAFLNLSNEDKQQFLIRMRSKFDVVRPNLDPKRQTGTPYWSIQITTTDAAADMAFLQAWLDASHQEVAQTLRQRILKAAESVDLAAKFAIEDTQRQLNYELEDYKKKTAQRLAALDEHAAIARRLGIAKSTIEGTTFAGKGSVVTNLKADNPLYLRGYEALEQEAKLIRSRQDDKQFISALVALEAQLRSLQDSPLSSRLKTLLQESPLSSDRFEAAQINVYMMAPSRSIGIARGAALGLIAGGLLGIFLALLVPAVRRELQTVGRKEQG
jgi:LPS O-antigen subunit length determinant protein (WzzB/FepE family)